MTIQRYALMRLNGLVRRCFFRNRWFARLVFGVRPAAPATEQNYCEWGTVAMRVFMGRYLRPDARILDVGTGTHAFLAIMAKRQCPRAAVTASDIVPDRVAAAQQTAARNNVAIACLVSDLFQAITGEFDVVLFHPPMTPTDVLEKAGCEAVSYAGLGARHDWSSDGGSDGQEVLRAFLQGLPGHLAAEGRGLVCFNPLDCPPARMAELAQPAGLRLDRVHRLPGIMNLYVLAADDAAPTPR